MKHHFHYLSALTIALLLTVFSCTSAKKTAVSCPDFSQSRNYHARHSERQAGRSDHNAFSLDSKRLKALFAGQAGTSQKRAVAVNVPENNDNSETESATPDSEDGIAAVSEAEGQPVEISKANESEFSGKEKNSVLNGSMQDECDTIVLRSGELIIAQVRIIGPKEVRYRQCGGNDIIFVVNINDVFMIKHADGTKDYFTQLDKNLQSRIQPGEKKTEGLSLTGFFASIVGFFIAGVPLGAMAMVFGIIGMGKISREPDRYRGKGFAIAAVLIGLIDIIGAIIVISMVL